MTTTIRKYLAEIGRKGGQKSRRALTAEQSAAMNKARWKKRKLKSDS
jgi:general stress protein YciG